MYNDLKYFSRRRVWCETSSRWLFPCLCWRAFRMQWSVHLSKYTWHSGDSATVFPQHYLLPKRATIFQYKYLFKWQVWCLHQCLRPWLCWWVIVTVQLIIMYYLYTVLSVCNEIFKMCRLHTLARLNLLGYYLDCIVGALNEKYRNIYYITHIL